MKAIINKHYGDLFDAEKYLDKFFEYSLSYPTNVEFTNRMMQGSTQYFDYEFLRDYVELVGVTARQAGRLKRVFSLVGAKGANIDTFCFIGFIKVCQPQFFDFLVDVIKNKSFSDPSRAKEYLNLIFKAFGHDEIKWQNPVQCSSRGFIQKKENKLLALKLKIYALIVGLCYDQCASPDDNSSFCSSLLKITPPEICNDEAGVSRTPNEQLESVLSLSHQKINVTGAITMFQKVMF